MKKSTIVVAVATIFLLSSCTTNGLIRKYERACKNGNVEKAQKTWEKIMKKSNNGAELTEEQLERLAEAEVALGGKFE